MLEQPSHHGTTNQPSQDTDTQDYLQDVKLQFNQAINTYFGEFYQNNCYLGLIFDQGKRKMIQINVPADELYKLLLAKPSSDKNNDPDAGKNRPEVKGHVDEVKDYILSRVEQDKPWILGTLTANVNPERI
ncbi:MAG: DNA sulfur modification protein DndB, partial [Microcystaceae cyanobacterium]